MSLNPFVIYARCGGLAFGLTFGTNLVMSNLVENPPIKMKQFPQLFSSALLLKSLTHGVLWPAIPHQVYNDVESYIIVGKGAEKTLELMDSKGAGETWKTYIKEVKEKAKWKIEEIK